MARWINVTEPFEYRFKDRSAVVVFTTRDLGDHLVKDEIADFAIERKAAAEGKFNPDSRSKKGGRKAATTRTRRAAAPKRAKASTTEASAGQPTRSQTGALGDNNTADEAADSQSASRLAGEGLAKDDRAANRNAVAGNGS
jgi:hypothetical protein